MPSIADRFRGFLPVVLDLETGGFNPGTDAVLEIAVCLLRMDDFGRLRRVDTVAVDVKPFEGAVIDPRSLEFTGIDLDDPDRTPLVEKEALRQISLPVRKEFQYGVLLGRQRDRATVPLHPPRSRVDSQRTDFDHGRRLRVLRL